MKKSSKIVLCIASTPLLISFLISVRTFFTGTEDFIFCHHPDLIYGLEAAIDTVSLLIMLFYPIYILSLVLIFRELYKIKMKYKDIKKYILYLISGSISIIFSLILVIVTFIIIKGDIITAFSIVCFINPFILLSNIISIIYIIKSIIEYRKYKVNKVNR